MNEAPPEGRLRRLEHWLLQDQGARLFAWTAWLVLFSVAFAYVHRYAVRLPICDDWQQYMDLLTGNSQRAFSRLWDQVNEHRIPLIKLVLFPIVYFTQGGFCVENYLIVLMLGGLAAVLIHTARRLRGRQHFTDAFFALGLLHLGHFEVLMQRMMLNHAVCAVLSVLVLIVLATSRGPLSVRRTLLLGGLLLCLPFCGANGLILVVMSALWLFFGARLGQADTTTELRRLRRVHVGIAAVLLAVVGIYFIGYVPCAHHPPPPSASAYLHACGELCAVAAGWVPPQFEPWPAVLVPAALGVSLVFLLHSFWRLPAERSRTLGLLVFLAAMAALILAMARGRGGLGPGQAGAPRYAIVTVPILLGCYLVCTNWAMSGPHWVRRGLEVALFGTFLAAYPLGATFAYGHGRHMLYVERALLQAVQDGAPISCVVQGGAGTHYPAAMVPYVTHWVRHLRSAGVEPFCRIQDDPVWEETALDPTPQDVHGMAAGANGWSVQGPPSYLSYRLTGPRFVDAVRLRLEPPQRGTLLHFFWGQSEVAPLPHHRRSALLSLPAGRKASQEILIWVHSSIDELRIQPEIMPLEFKVREVTLLRKKQSAELDASERLEVK